MYDPDKVLYSLTEYLAGLRLVESGSIEGDYDAVNPTSGAYGAYQITPKYMDYIVETAGYNVNDIADPAVQDGVASFWARVHFEEFGNWDLCGVAWHAGASNARLPLIETVPCSPGPAVTVDMIESAIPGESSYVFQVRDGAQLWREKMNEPDYSGHDSIYIDEPGDYFLLPQT